MVEIFSCTLIDEKWVFCQHVRQLDLSRR
jgi:hypothetical protein